MNRQPSLIKVLTIDFLALLGWLLPVVLWGFYIFILLTGEQIADNFTLAILFGVATVASLGVLFWRILLFNNIFNDGIEEPATICNILFFRDRGRVDYVYIHQGNRYVSSNAIHKVPQTRALRIGDQVVVMVDRNNPQRAFIRDLYM